MRARRLLAEIGAPRLLGYALQRLFSRQLAWWMAYRLATCRFCFEGEELAYLIHPYNTTWLNGRAVELPIILRLAGGLPKAACMLEVGNVLGHYLPRSWPVVDRFESGPQLISKDIMDYVPKEPLDLIVSISTFEHIGFDEDVRDGEKAHRAIQRCRSWLSMNGKMIFTVPLGYNPHIDALFRDGRLNLSDFRFLKRIGTTEWRETEYSDVANARYHFPYLCDNALAIGEVRR